MEQERIQANLQKHQGELQQPEPDSTADDDMHSSPLDPIEAQVKKAALAVAATLAENAPVSWIHFTVILSYQRFPQRPYTREESN